MRLGIKDRDVRYWHKADILVALHMSAFGGKADITKLRDVRKRDGLVICGDAASLSQQVQAQGFLMTEIT